VSAFALGLDLGPGGEFTALAVAQAVEGTDGTEASESYVIRHLRRFPPGTPYRQVADEVLALVATKELVGASLAIDVTAVGTGVLGPFRDADPTPYVIPVVLTAGQHPEADPKGGMRVPKKDLITRLQLLLQGRRLQVPAALPDADLLARELANYRPRVSLATDPMAVEWREGQADDLVLAVGLACWQAARRPRGLDWEPVIGMLRRNPSTCPGGLFRDVGGRDPWGR
jgi:hypothetical protein